MCSITGSLLLVLPGFCCKVVGSTVVVWGTACTKSEQNNMFTYLNGVISNIIHMYDWF
jgi:hypothetical protein